MIKQVAVTIFVVVAATGLFALLSPISAIYAKGANQDHANEVAPNANTNGPYIKDCKETNSAKDCATGPGNNGDFTSGAAHEINKP